MGVTKDQYLEMCEALNSEPLEEEIPIEYEDLCLDVQNALGIYFKLKDEWDTMNGNYMGKNYSGIADIFTILEVPKEDWKVTFDLIGIIDRHRSEIIRKEKEKTKPESKTTPKNPAK